MQNLLIFWFSNLSELIESILSIFVEESCCYYDRQGRYIKQ